MKVSHSMIKYISLVLFLCSLLQANSEVPDIYQTASDLARTVLQADAVSLYPLRGGARAQVFKAYHTCVIRYMNKNNTLERCEREITIAQYAAEKGFGPRILYADAQSGVMVMESLDILRAPCLLFDTQEWNRQIGHTVHLLHQAPLQSTYAETIFDRYRRVFSTGLPKGIETLVSVDFFNKCLDECDTLFPSSPGGYVCSHDDLHAGNFLYTSQGFRIIDYEFIANNSPYVDLAFVAVDNSSNYENDNALLEGYFGRTPTKYEKACLSILKHVLLLCRGLVDLSYRPQELIKRYIDNNESARYLSMAYKHGDFDIVNNENLTRRALMLVREALWYFESDNYVLDKNTISLQSSVVA